RAGQMGRQVEGRLPHERRRKAARERPSFSLEPLSHFAAAGAKAEVPVDAPPLPGAQLMVSVEKEPVLCLLTRHEMRFSVPAPCARRRSPRVPPQPGPAPAAAAPGAPGRIGT